MGIDTVHECNCALYMWRVTKHPTSRSEKGPIQFCCLQLSGFVYIPWIPYGVHLRPTNFDMVTKLESMINAYIFLHHINKNLP